MGWWSRRQVERNRELDGFPVEPIAVAHVRKSLKSRKSKDNTSTERLMLSEEERATISKGKFLVPCYLTVGPDGRVLGVRPSPFWLDRVRVRVEGTTAILEGIADYEQP